MSQEQNRMSITPFASGVFVDNNPVTIPMAGAPLPSTVALKSVDSTRQFEVILPNGIFFKVPPSLVTAAGIALFITSSITSIKLTGVTGDAWSIL